MSPGEWLQHASESVVVAGAVAVGWRRVKTVVAKLEQMIENLGAVSDLKLTLEAHIATPADQAHARATSPASSPRRPMGSSPGNA